MTSDERYSPLPWALRKSTMPYLPGAADQQLTLLTNLFEEIDRVEGAIYEEIHLGSGEARKLSDLVKQTQPAGLTHMIDRQHCAPTPEATAWRSSGDPIELLAIFHRNSRFIGELLEAMKDGPVTTTGLRKIAQQTYLLNWATNDQVRRRIIWLVNLGYVEYKTSTDLVLTDAGSGALSQLSLGGPDSLPAQPSQVDIPHLPAEIMAQVESLNSASLAAREPVLGYIPRGGGEMDIVGSFQAMVNAASPQISRSDYIDFQKLTFSSSESSFGAALTTLTKTGLVDQVIRDRFTLTPLGECWLDSPSPLGLAVIIHSRYRFVLEILSLLDEYPDAPHLAQIGHTSYGLNRVDPGGVRTRLQILKAAGLIYERGPWKYQPTALGLAMLDEIPIEAALETANATPPLDPSGRNDRAIVLEKELIESSVAADTPGRLEIGVTDALNYLGFDARRIGGSGQTDVLATAFDEANRPIRVIFDAKSAGSGSVQESAVSFDTLREHREAHKADLVVLVGPGFESGRIKKRAIEHQVTLLTARELGRILVRHADTPLSAYHYLGLLSPSPDVRAKSDQGWGRAERRLDLLSRIVGVLAEESAVADAVTGGALTVDQIYLIAREAVDPRPSTRDIESVLQFLEHPIVECVVGTGGQGRNKAYRLVDSPSLVVMKLKALASRVDALGAAAAT